MSARISTQRAARSGPLPEHATWRLDYWSRRRQGIEEHSSDPLRLTRVNRTLAERDLSLPDRAEISIGSSLPNEAAHHESDAAGALQRSDQNCFMFWLLWKTNPIASRSDVFRRDHALIYLSRPALERRYGEGKR